MKEKLIKLYNTLCTIETKGENTKTMAACLNYLTQMVLDVEAANSAPVTPTVDEDSNGGE